MIKTNYGKLHNVRCNSKLIAKRNTNVTITVLEDTIDVSIRI